MLKLMQRLPLFLLLDQDRSVKKQAKNTCTAFGFLYSLGCINVAYFII